MKRLARLWMPGLGTALMAGLGGPALALAAQGHCPQLSAWPADRLSDPLQPQSGASSRPPAMDTSRRSAGAILTGAQP